MVTRSEKSRSGESPPSFLREIAGGVEIAVKVVPGASRDRIVGPLGDALKIQVAAPPERGRANERVSELLAATLGVARSAVRLAGGAANPRKVFHAAGISIDEAARRLS